MAARSTVVVCSRDRPAELAECLAAVRATLGADDSLVVVDSASTTAATGEAATAAGATVVRATRPGLSHARNLGLAAAAADVVLFTDDDCRPQPGWVDAVVAAFAADGRVGFVTGRVRGEGGGMPVVVLDDDRPRALLSDAPLEQLGHGANLAVRASAARAVGGFDELLGAGAAFVAGEDTDLMRRLLAAGWTGRYQPDAVVTHRQWRGRRDAIRAAYGYGVGFGAVAGKARVDGRAGRRLLWRGVGPAGVGHAARDLAARYPFGAAVCLAWTAGVVSGNVRARRYDVADGVMVERRR